MTYRNQEKVSNELAVQTQKAVAHLAQQSEAYLKKQLPTKVISTLVNDVRMAISKSVGQNKGATLAECDPSSILACMVNGATVGVSLNPDLREAYLVPFRNGDHYVAQLNISFIGMRNMVMRDTGIKMRAECVYSNEPLEYYSDGFEQIYRHTFLDEVDRGELILAFSMAKFPDGQVLYERMTKVEIDKCKKASKGSDSQYSPWKIWEESMWLKSVTRRHCKNLPNISNETAEALANDEAMAIGRPQFMETAYKKAGIEIEPPKPRTEEESDSAFDDIFAKKEPVAEVQPEEDI